MPIEPYQFPETCSCCNTDSSTSSGGGGSGDSGREWILFGEIAPEGNVVADRRTIYRRRNEAYYELYMKEHNDGSAFGWLLYHQVAAPTV